MDVPIIHHENPRGRRVGGHRLLDVAGEVRLRPRRANRRSDQLPGRHLEVADQGQRPMPRGLELDLLAVPVGHRPTGGVSFQRLNARHLVAADRVRPVVPLQRGRLEVGVTDRLDLLLKLHWVLLGGVEPIPLLVGLQGGLAEITPHLGHRDRRHDAALHHLIGQFVGRPVSDGPTGLLRGLAGHGQDLDDLLRSELAGGGRTGAHRGGLARWPGARRRGCRGTRCE